MVLFYSFYAFLFVVQCVGCSENLLQTIAARIINMKQSCVPSQSDSHRLGKCKSLQLNQMRKNRGPKQTDSMQIIPRVSKQQKRASVLRQTGSFIKTEPMQIKQTDRNLYTSWRCC